MGLIERAQILLNNLWSVHVGPRKESLKDL